MHSLCMEPKWEETKENGEGTDGSFQQGNQLIA
jgi:hypothetical protein